VTVGMTAWRTNTKFHSKFFFPLDVRTRLFGIFSVHCDETDRLMITYPTFVRQVTKQNTTEQINSCSQTSGRAIIRFGREIWCNIAFGSGVATNIVRLDIKRLNWRYKKCGWAISWLVRSVCRVMWRQGMLHRHCFWSPLRDNTIKQFKCTTVGSKLTARCVLWY
jgi:hypothetical protein